MWRMPTVLPSKQHNEPYACNSELWCLMWISRERWFLIVYDWAAGCLWFLVCRRTMHWHARVWIWRHLQCACKQSMVNSERRHGKSGKETKEGLASTSFSWIFCKQRRSFYTNMMEEAFFYCIEHPLCLWIHMLVCPWFAGSNGASKYVICNKHADHLLVACMTTTLISLFFAALYSLSCVISLPKVVDHGKRKRPKVRQREERKVQARTRLCRLL